MFRRNQPKDAPVNNLMVRSQLACSFSGPWNCRFPPTADRLAAFSSLFHDHEGSYPRNGDKSFRDHEVLAQEPCLEVTSASAGSFSRVPGAFIADRIIVGLYPRCRVGKGPR